MSALLPIHGRKGLAAHALVDPDVHAWAREYRWSLAGGPPLYVARQATVGGRTRTIYLHREILGVSGLGRAAGLVDHINGDELDNRRSNLRLVTQSGNQLNRRGATCRSRTGVRSVELMPSGRYRARVQRYGRNPPLGVFATAEQASAAVAAFVAEQIPYELVEVAA